MAAGDNVTAQTSETMTVTTLSASSRSWLSSGAWPRRSAILRSDAAAAVSRSPSQEPPPRASMEATGGGSDGPASRASSCFYFETLTDLILTVGVDEVHLPENSVTLPATVM